jgi:hypothetical protein
MFEKKKMQPTVHDASKNPFREKGLQSSTFYELRILPDSPPVYRTAKHFGLMLRCLNGKVDGNRTRQARYRASGFAAPQITTFDRVPLDKRSI